MPEITVIVTIYQAERYLKKCIESIERQSFSNWELLLIDDGSTDKSGEIAEEYARKDARIYYHRKENGGVSSARNEGVRLAKGRYLAFVDSDDTIAADLLETLYELILKYGAQMSICRGLDCYEGEEMPAESGEIREFVTDTSKGLYQVLRARGFSVQPWGKLYQKELFDGVWYPDQAIAEDAYVMLPLMEHCEKIAFTTAQKYYYLHRKESLTTKSFRWSDLGSVKVWDHNYQEIKKKHPELLEQAMVRRCWARFFVLDKLMLLDHPKEDEKKLAKKLAGELKRHPKVILEKDHFLRGRKAAYLSLFLGLWAYRLIVRASMK